MFSGKGVITHYQARKLTLHSMNDRNGMCSLKQIDCPENVWLPDQMSGGIAIAS